MFLELILVVFLSLVIFVLDYYYRTLAILLCLPTVYFILYFFPFVNEPFVFLVLGKICALFAAVPFWLRKLPFSKSLITIESKCDPERTNLECEIDILVSKISRYCIKSWYCEISDNQDFINYLNSTIKEIIFCLCTKTANSDKKKLSCIIIQIYKHFLIHFLQLKQNSENLRWDDFQMKHWAVKDRSTEWCYLQSLMSEIIDIFGPYDCDKSLHSKTSPVIHTVIVEILAENIINRLVFLLSDPSSLNLILLKIALKLKENYFINTDCEKYSNINLKSGNFTSIKPVILVNSEDSMTNTLQSHNLSVSSKESNFLFNESNLYTLKSTPNSKNDFISVVSSGAKSSSNTNLSNELNANINYDSPICDNTIKRSKSADFIRQIPHLKAVNLKDFKITPQKKNKMLIALIPESGVHTNVDQAEEAIEIEVPTLFTDIQIAGTIQENDAGIFPYTLYCIQYSALFHDTEKSEVPHFVRKVSNIKRRFKEFHALQNQLENNSDLKHYLKGIKGPCKGLQFPFTNLDKKNIAERKTFLENYLQELCNIAPISQSAELQEFLGYGCRESGASVVKKSSDINVSRLDKMFVRGVKGAIDIFKTALPNSPLDGENPVLYKTHCEDVNQTQKVQEPLLDYSSRDPDIKEHISQFISSTSDLPIVNCPEDLEYFENCKRLPFLKTIDFDISKCCEYCTNLNGSFYNQEESPIGNSIVDVFLLATELNHDSLLPIVKFLCSSYIERYLTDTVINVSESDIATCVNFIHTHLWPDETAEPAQDFETNADIIKDILEDFLSSKNIPSWLKILRKFPQNALNLFLISIQNQEANKCFLFQMFDAILEAL